MEIRQHPTGVPYYGKLERFCRRQGSLQAKRAEATRCTICTRRARDHQTDRLRQHHEQPL